MDKAANDDERHFYVCPSCGQRVDRRDLSQVFHHETPHQLPIGDEEDSILTRIRGFLWQ